MYGLSVFINEEDILNRLSEEDRARFNRCVFYDARRNLDGSGITIDCLLINDNDIQTPKAYCGSDIIRLFKEET